LNAQHQATCDQQASNGWIATDRSVLFVVTDGAASDAGVNSAALTTQSELLTDLDVDVYGIGVGDQRHMFVSCNFTVCSIHLHTHSFWGILLVLDGRQSYNPAESGLRKYL
jgi:hypothetical protein